MCDVIDLCLCVRSVLHAPLQLLATTVIYCTHAVAGLPKLFGRVIHEHCAAEAVSSLNVKLLTAVP